MEKNIKHAMIVPLIGGFGIATKNELKRVPEFILSYPCFEDNDNQYFHNYPDEKNNYMLLEDYTNKFINKKDEKKFNKLNKNIDIVTSICPCSGLSMLNASKKEGSATARGSDAIQNRFMFLTSNFVLKNIKPKVFMFENAPAMYTKSGEGVFDKLVIIAKENGYSFTAFKTSTIKHGIPQNRSRSFGFFWKSEYAPILNYYDRPYENIVEYLSQINPEALYNDTEGPSKAYNDNAIMSFIKHEEGPNYREKFFKGKMATGLHYLSVTNKLDKIIDFLDEEKNKSDIRLVKHVKKKLGMGKGYWDSSPIIINDTINAVISKNAFRFVHPAEERYLTTRECMWLMGLPDNFNLTNEKCFNMITQNVPVNTAQDMIKEAVKFINGDLEISNSEVVKQNNMQQRIDFQSRQTKKNNFSSLYK